IAQPEIGRMSELAVLGPLRELHLSNQCGPHPVRFLVGARRRCERADARLKGVKALPHATELCVGEARAAVADLLQGAALVEDAEQERAEDRTRPARVGPSADNAGLTTRQLHLAPIRRAARGPIQGVQALGDESFPAVLGRARVERPAIADDLLAETHARMTCAGEHALEVRAPLAQGAPAEILVPLAQHVERDDSDASGGTG